MIDLNRWKNEFGLIGMSDGTYWEGGDAAHKTGYAAGMSYLAGDFTKEDKEWLVKALNAIELGPGMYRRSTDIEPVGGWQTTRDQMKGLVFGMQAIPFTSHASNTAEFITSMATIGYDIIDPQLVAFSSRCLKFPLPRILELVADFMFFFSVLLRWLVFKTDETSNRMNDINYAIMSKNGILKWLIRKDCESKHGSVQGVLDVYFSRDAPPLNEVARPVIKREFP